MKAQARSYGEDIAYIHDVAFSGFANAAAPNLIAMLRAHGISSGTIVDLGCGAGAWARHLVDAGYDVLGIDISPAMLRIARAKVPEARFRQASLLRATIPPCSAVTSIGECLNYLFDARNNHRQRSRLFRRIYSSLKPGGVFLFDVAINNVQFKPRKNYSLGKDWLIAVAVTKERGRLARNMVSLRRINSNYRMRQETHRQLLFDPSEIRTELSNAGFKVQLLYGYGKFRFDSLHRGFLARKAFQRR